jgi:3-oxoacyl-[acyl-carrier protein] reductase
MTQPDYDLSGKVALITGASRGIGAAIAMALAECGARCALNYLDDPAGQNRADVQAVAATLANPLLLPADVGDAEQVARMFDRVQAEAGGLDLLVNNAGILRDRTIKKMTEADWDAVLRVNLTGTFHCIQQATSKMRSGGRIVNLASVAGVLGFFGQANYAASKAGIIALTKVAARELARQQITVNAIAPGFIDTDMTRDMPADVKAKFLEQIPAGRMGLPADIAHAVLFLCAAQSSYFTGQVLHVNGGFYMGS